MYVLQEWEDVCVGCGEIHSAGSEMCVACEFEKWTQEEECAV